MRLAALGRTNEHLDIYLNNHIIYNFLTVKSLENVTFLCTLSIVECLLGIGYKNIININNLRSDCSLQIILAHLHLGSSNLIECT